MIDIKRIIYLTVVFSLFLLVAMMASQTAYSLDCAVDYKRSDYRHWVGDTRQVILARDSLIPVIRNNKGKIISGLWEDPYTQFKSADPSDFDIEHAYALEDAHTAGACNLSKELKKQLANDERNLFVAWKGSNRTKGSKTLIEWWPSDLSFIGKYADMRRLIADEYGLTPSACERLALDYFDGFGEYFQKGINLNQVRIWIKQHRHIFAHPCFHSD